MDVGRNLYWLWDNDKKKKKKECERGIDDRTHQTEKGLLYLSFWHTKSCLLDTFK